MPEIVPVVSETLEAQIRDLLPSQAGFGEDLHASNVIMPIIDLTAAAEGSGTPTYLQTAIAFGSQTAFQVSNTTTTLINSPGFYRVFGTSTGFTSGVANETEFIMDDGLSQKRVWGMFATSTGSAAGAGPYIPFDFTVFLRAGDSLIGKTDSSNMFLTGSTRQVATVNGVLVNPLGFTPQ